MKRLTEVVLWVFAVHFSGYSQTLPMTFDQLSSAEDYFTCYDCSFNLTTDPLDATNIVGELTSFNYAEFGSAQTIELDQYIDLSDDNNNTITFRIKPVNGTGSGSHLLKFSGGSTPFGAEVAFTTVGTDWQDITLDFGSGLGTYRNLIIFPDFFNIQTDTYLIDDIQGAVNTAPRPTPSNNAPAPSFAASQVKSVYSESYTNLNYLYNFFESFREVDIENNGNKALEVDLGYYGAGFQNTDVSSDSYVHFDYWTSDATKFAFRVNSENPLVNDKQYILGVDGDQPIILNSWTSVFIPLSHYSDLGVNLEDVYQYNFVDAGGTGTIFIDNIYFTSANILKIEDLPLRSFKLQPNPTKDIWRINSLNENILSLDIYDIFGKKVMSLNPNNKVVKVNGTTLSSGLYYGQIKTSNTVTIYKLIKQ